MTFDLLSHISACIMYVNMVIGSIGYHVEPIILRILSTMYTSLIMCISNSRLPINATEGVYDECV